MTPAEAIAALEAADPKRSYCVSVDEWSHAGIGRETHYTVHVFPGTNGTGCQTFRKEPLPSLVAQAIASLPLTATTEAIAQVAAGLTDEALLKRP